MDIGMPCSDWTSEFGGRDRGFVSMYGRHGRAGDIQCSRPDGFGTVDVCPASPRGCHASTGAVGRRWAICGRRCGILDQGIGGEADASGRRDGMQDAIAVAAASNSDRPADPALEIVEFEDFIGLPSKLVGHHGRLGAYGRNHRGMYAVALHGFDQATVIAIT